MKRDKWELKKNWRGYLLVFPACVAVILVSIYPMIYGSVIAFKNYVLTKSFMPDFGQFAGLKNFISVMAKPEFRQACMNTVFWTVTNVVVQVILATLIALALNRNIRCTSFFRTTALIPWAVPSVIAAMTFRFLYDTNVGIVNVILVKLGILDQPMSILGNIETARWAVVLESIWKGTPFVMIFILAALQSVPKDTLESAVVDGANAFQSFFRIVLPHIKGSVGIAMILTTIGTINNFNAVWLMTMGGPSNSTEIMFTYAYRRAFNGNDFGEAAAVSVMMFILIAVLTSFYVKLMGEEN